MPTLARTHAALAVATAVLISSTPPAVAQAREARVIVEAAEPGQDLSVTYRVRVVSPDDGEPINGARVTVAAEAAGGVAAEVELAATDTDGRYAGYQHYPSAGTWTIDVRVESPPGALQFVQDVGIAPSTTAASEASDVPPKSELGPTSTTPPSGRRAAAEAPEDPGEITVGSLIFLVAIVVAVGGLAIVLIGARLATARAETDKASSDS